ncbi:MAG TPA: FAD-dependent oxidoreductase [Chlamydiales bacterium]|nr:FAD-dependent oxidoreductase [Chlamydiales bacterium]
MRAAVVGAGIAGWAVTWHLLQKGCAVTLFDRGGGASAASTGLLHPFPGKEARRSWRADEGMRASLALLQAASGSKPVFSPCGILRLAVTEQQKFDFEEDSSSYLSTAISTPAMWIPEGIAVYSRPYLEELAKLCKNAKIVHQSVSLKDLDRFDATVLACGADILEFDECKHLPLKRVIGQSLICQWPERLPFALLASGHITPTENPELCQVGSTYEHTREPDPKKALELIDKCALFYPPAKDFKVVEIRSGVRISPKIGYRPLIAKVDPKTWVFTGLGSRGLLYHALLSKELVDTMGTS